VLFRFLRPDKKLIFKVLLINLTMIWRFWSGRFMNVIEGGNVNNHPHCTSNLYNFVYAVTIEWQKSTSYFPYIMYNTKKIRTCRDVQYGKIWLPVLQYGKNNVRSKKIRTCRDVQYGKIRLPVVQYGKNNVRSHV
jgi:hypothetical protein